MEWVILEQYKESRNSFGGKSIKDYVIKYKICLLIRRMESDPLFNNHSSIKNKTYVSKMRNPGY
jgi:hypothetical protein